MYKKWKCFDLIWKLSNVHAPPQPMIKFKNPKTSGLGSWTPDVPSSVGSAGLRHGSHMPLPLPNEDNLRVIVQDGLALADLAKEAAFSGVVDHHPVDGGVAHLVWVVEPSVLGKGALVYLVPLDVRLVTLSGAVVT